jgi:hypothetical protein
MDESLYILTQHEGKQTLVKASKETGRGEINIYMRSSTPGTSMLGIIPVFYLHCSLQAFELTCQEMNTHGNNAIAFDVLL